MDNRVRSINYGEVLLDNILSPTFTLLSENIKKVIVGCNCITWKKKGNKIKFSLRVQNYFPPKEIFKKDFIVKTYHPVIIYSNGDRESFEIKYTIKRIKK